jgi:hypothetical protein
MLTTILKTLIRTLVLPRIQTVKNEQLLAFCIWLWRFFRKRSGVVGFAAGAVAFSGCAGLWWRYQGGKEIREGIEARATAVLRRFELHVCDIGEVSYDDNLPVREANEGEDDKEKARPRRRKVSRMEEMSFALAQATYFKFGRRKQNDANMLVSRRFMRDELEEYDDLRYADANVIIDKALPLSFLSTTMAIEMDKMVGSRPFADRLVGGASMSWWERMFPLRH